MITPVFCILISQQQSQKKYMQFQQSPALHPTLLNKFRRHMNPCQYESNHLKQDLLIVVKYQTTWCTFSPSSKHLPQEYFLHSRKMELPNSIIKKFHIFSQKKAVPIFQETKHYYFQEMETQNKVFWCKESNFLQRI